MSIWTRAALLILALAFAGTLLYQHRLLGETAAELSATRARLDEIAARMAEVPVAPATARAVEDSDVLPEAAPTQEGASVEETAPPVREPVRAQSETIKTARDKNARPEERLEAARALLASGQPTIRFQGVLALLELKRTSEALPAAREVLAGMKANEHNGDWVMYNYLMAGIASNEGTERELRGYLAPSESLKVRSAAAGALEKQGDRAPMRDVLDEISTQSRSPVSSVRARAATTLSQTLSEQATPYLEPLLRDPDLGVRRSATLALTYIPGDEARELAQRMLNDPSPAVRDAAVRVVDQSQRR